MPVPMMAPHQGEGETGGQPTARQGAGDPERDDDRTEEEDLAIAALEGDEPAGHRLGDAAPTMSGTIATAAARTPMEARGRRATFGRLSAIRVEPSLAPLTAANARAASASATASIIRPCRPRSPRRGLLPCSSVRATPSDMTR